MAREKVARTRLSQDEYKEFVEEPARAAGVSPAEYLRTLIVSSREIGSRVTALENRVTHIETEVAKMWAQEVKDHDQQGI